MKRECRPPLFIRTLVAQSDESITHLLRKQVIVSRRRLGGFLYRKRSESFYAFASFFISRLRESEINFVFCERVLYVCTAPEQKTKSANNGKDSMSLPLFQSLRVQQVAPTVSPVVSVGASALKCRGLHWRPAPFAREAKRFIYFYLARFSRFIDSL